MVCGALHIADKTIETAFQDYISSLEKGQIQASNALTNVVDVELINNGNKYKVQASKSGTNTYFLQVFYLENRIVSDTQSNDFCCR